VATINHRRWWNPSLPEST